MSEMKKIDINSEELDSKFIYYKDRYRRLIKLGTTAKVVGWCKYDNDYYEKGYHNSSIVIHTDLNLYFKIILQYCSYYEYSSMIIVGVDFEVNITHFPIKDYYIDLKLFCNYNYDCFFKSDVFEFSKGCEFKVYEEKFIEHSIKETRDLREFEMLMDDMKSIKEELLEVVFHPSRIEKYLKQGIKVGELDKII